MAQHGKHAKSSASEHKLGFFMHWLEFWYLLMVFIAIAGLMVVRKDMGTLETSVETALSGIDSVCSAVALWLLWTRKRAARGFIAIYNVFNIATSVYYSAVAGDLDVVSIVISCIPNIITIAYMLLSRRAKAALTQPFDEQTKLDHLGTHDIYQPRTWAFWRNLLIYFCVFSVVGHWMEAAYCTLIRFGIIPGIYDPNSQIWSDWFYPFCVYGFGACACVLIMYPIKRAFEKRIHGHVIPLILSFLVNASICAGIELTMGLMLNQHYELWDYRNMFGNFLGQICLQNAMAFGFVATLMTWVVYPVLEALLSHFTPSQMMIIFLAIVVIFCMLFFFYCVNVLILGFNDADSVARVLGSGGQ